MVRSYYTFTRACTRDGYAPHGTARYRTLHFDTDRTIEYPSTKPIATVPNCIVPLLWYHRIDSLIDSIRPVSYRASVGGRGRDEQATIRIIFQQYKWRYCRTLHCIYLLYNRKSCRVVTCSSVRTMLYTGICFALSTVLHHWLSRIRIRINPSSRVCRVVSHASVFLV